jgi:cobalt-zinc-cadmium efflux system outer membrane protein
MTVEGDLTPLTNVTDAVAGLGSLSERPEMLIFDAERKAMTARAEAFRRSRIPNPTLSVFALNDGYNERVYGVGIAFPIPLPTPVGRTYAGEIAEAEALAQRAQTEQARWGREIRLGVAAALATFAAHRQMVEALKPEALQRAESTLRDLGQEIEAGRMAVRDALLAQQTLIELLKTNIAERTALCLASVELARALGLPLEKGAQ